MAKDVIPIDADSAVAIRICAPYGIIPWTQHEVVSIKLAARSAFKPYFSDNSFTIEPDVIIATVLLAVNKLMTVGKKKEETAEIVKTDETILLEEIRDLLKKRK